MATSCGKLKVLYLEGMALLKEVDEKKLQVLDC